MRISFLISATSAALFFFNILTICERVIRREFVRTYCRGVNNAIQVECPHLQDAVLSRAPLIYSGARLALQCDFMTMGYLLKNANRTEHLSLREKMLFLYFRFLLFCLPIRHTLKLGENEAIWELATILQSFGNLVGEKLTLDPVGGALPALSPEATCVSRVASDDSCGTREGHSP